MGNTTITETNGKHDLQKGINMEDRAYPYMNWPAIEAIVYSEECSPRDYMAPRLTPDGVLIQGFFPGAFEASVITGRKVIPMTMEDETGYFAVLIPGRKIPEYHFRVTRESRTQEFKDAYAFPGLITEQEEKAFCAGVWYEAWRKLGAHAAVINGTAGVYFAVWAPNAMRVSVVGAFDEWDGRAFPMHRMPMSGIFELFIPGLDAQESYLYEIKTRSGEIMLKCDPYSASVPNDSDGQPPLLSIPRVEDGFKWSDEDWMDGRGAFAGRDKPLFICELSLTGQEDPQELVRQVLDQGFTHVELHPLMLSLQGPGGYSTASYFGLSEGWTGFEAVKSLVNLFHKNGIGVFMDWTPAQFPRFYGGMQVYDGTPLYEPADPACAVHPKWGTMLYNYDSPMAREFLLSNACFWLEECHMDGLRADDVDAMLYLDYGRENMKWTPNLYGTNENLAAVEFIKHLTSIVHKRCPGSLIIAQEDGLWPELTSSVDDDHPGFDYKWNTSWTGELLGYLSRGFDARTAGHDQLTLSMLYAYCEHYILALAGRDIGSLEDFASRMPGTADQQAAQVRLALAYMMLHPGGKMTLPAPASDEPLRQYLQDLGSLYRGNPAMYLMDNEYEGFDWIQLTRSEENVLAFERRTTLPGQTILAVCNFSDREYDKYQVGVPFHGRYKEIFNSDQERYGGQGMTNPRVKNSRPETCDERAQSIVLRLAPFSVSVFSCTPVSNGKEKTRK
ncbi:MAG: alpha amylase C-terminal domain-containing protein [Blautia sp.]|nr:alpha amylase C-terminal domain-containing protein [Blautia sp.]